MAQNKSAWLAFDTETDNMFNPTTVAPGGGNVFAKPPVKTPTQQDINAAVPPPAPLLPQFTPQSGGLPEHQNQDLPYGFTPYTDKPEYQALLSQMAGNRSLAEAQQQQGIQQYEDLLNAQSVRNQNQQVDLSPLASLVDSWTGSRLASGYKAPVSARSNLDATVALQQGLQKAKGALTDDQLAYLSQRAGLLQKGDETVAGLLAAQARLKEQGQLADRAYGAKGAKTDADLRIRFDEEYGQNLSSLGEFASSLTDVKRAIADSGNQVPLAGPQKAAYDSAVAKMLVRYNSDVAKLGALAGADLKLLEKAIANGPDAVSGWFSRKFGGDTAGVLKVLDSLERDADKSVDLVGKKAKAVYGAPVMGVYDVGRTNYFERKKTGSAPETVATKAMTREEKIKLLEARKAGGGQ